MGLISEPALFFFEGMAVAVAWPPPTETVPITTMIPLGPILNTSPPTVALPPTVKVCPAMTTELIEAWVTANTVLVAKVVGPEFFTPLVIVGVGAPVAEALGRVMIWPFVVIAPPG